MSQSQGETIKIRKLESFLQKSLDCKQLELVDVSAKKLLPLGENYQSVIVKLDATIHRANDAENETLHFVAKISNPSEQPVATWSEVFLKEVFMYSKVIPAYKRLEQQLGIEPVLDVFPKFIGHRCSLNDSKDVVDEDSMLVLENLRPRGFYTGDRRVGLNLEHARKALSCIARFHALGIALKKHDPNVIKTVIGKCQESNGNFKMADDGFASVLKTFRINDSFNKHLPVIESTFAEAKNGNLWTRAGSAPWETITHGDFWTNNIMFHKDEQGRVDDVKFIDFQLYMHGSPLKDLPVFLCCCLDETTKVHHMDELIDLYYESFTRSLESVGVDTEPFARAAFDRELKQQALIQFPLCALVFKFLDVEIKEEHESSTIANDICVGLVSDKVLRNLKQLVDLYEASGWF